MILRFIKTTPFPLFWCQYSRTQRANPLEFQQSCKILKNPARLKRHAGMKCKKSILSENNAVFVGLFDDGQRVVVDAHVAQPVAAALEALFDRNTHTDKLRARLLN